MSVLEGAAGVSNAFGACLANPYNCLALLQGVGQASYTVSGGKGTLNTAQVVADAGGTALATGGGIVEGINTTLSTVERIAMWGAIVFLVVLGLALIAATVYFTAPIMTRLL